MNDFTFKPAIREAAPVFIGIEGESGSGKTYSALLLARGIVGPKGKIGIADTEGKRSLMYADDQDIGGFLHMDFVAPYSSDRFREMIHAAKAAGLDALVIDSASHEHEAEGGMLDYADREEQRMASNPRKTQAKWIKPKMAHNRFVRTALSCGLHIIFCIRIKTIIDTDTKPPTKVKWPVCESNLPYEFTLRLRVEDQGIARFEKVPKPFQKHVRDGERITVEHGALLMKEAGKGADVSKVTRIISNLEEAAGSGTEVFKTAWMAAWRNNGPDGDVKTVTPERAELNKHLDRLKRLASDADTAGQDSGEDDRAPDDPGKFDKPAEQKQTTPENAYDDEDLFPGDLK